MVEKKEPISSIRLRFNGRQSYGRRPGFIRRSASRRRLGSGRGLESKALVGNSGPLNPRSFENRSGKKVFFFPKFGLENFDILAKKSISNMEFLKYFLF